MIDRILHLAGFGQCPHYHVSSTSTYSGIHPAEIPPRGGKSPFLEAPIEVRHQILTYLIHDKGNIVRPCMQKSTTSNKKNAGISFTCKLLTLNKKIAAELLLTLYEERTFVIDVFEGLERGGVEFLNAGCQPLQYKFGSHDTRFKRFENKNNKWGFSRLKHLIINIHPTSTDEIFNTHHVSLATYFMVLALCKLLERSNNKKEQICHIKVCFVKPKESSTEDAVGHQVTMKAERYWWNPDTDAPRETSIYGVPNVKLVLLPLSHLSNVQNVTIELPSSLNECKAITTWRDELEKPMKCRLPTLHLDDDFQYKMGAARDALEAFIFEKKYGGCPTELEPGHWMSDEDYNEEDFENPVDTEAEGRVPRGSPEPSTGYTGYAGQRKGKGKAKLIGLFQDLPASTPTCSGSWNILFNADGDGRSTYTASPSSPNYTDSQESSQERARGWDTNASGWDALHAATINLSELIRALRYLVQIWPLGVLKTAPMKGIRATFPDCPPIAHAVSATFLLIYPSRMTPQAPVTPPIFPAA
ncbi:hypothetical protein H2203_004585 [Taxawa tesnikishii (nom. ined.)]|nr:hypothetical protein H2203_004585 [Dothideales sp. JES 119]